MPQLSLSSFKSAFILYPSFYVSCTFPLPNLFSWRDMYMFILYFHNSFQLSLSLFLYLSIYLSIYLSMSFSRSFPPSLPPSLSLSLINAYSHINSLNLFPYQFISDFSPSLSHICLYLNYVTSIHSIVRKAFGKIV